MKYVIFIIVSLGLFSIFSVSAFGQTLYVNPNDDDLVKINNSKYIASSINVLRNSNGDLISVVKTDASRYLPDPITDEYLDTLPIFKQGIINEQDVKMRQVNVNYNYEKCITEVYQVPGYSDQCNWYHRAYVTSLGINKDGDGFEIFRGLNHSYTVKPSDSVTCFWTIITRD